MSKKLAAFVPERSLRSIKHPAVGTARDTVGPIIAMRASRTFCGRAYVFQAERGAFPDVGYANTIRAELAKGVAPAYPV
jgi:hypothetical protein